MKFSKSWVGDWLALENNSGCRKPCWPRKLAWGVATLRRIEAGQDSQMESWLKLLKALQLASAVDAILPENVNSPMAEVRAKPRKKHKAAVQAVAQGPPWGDEQT